MNDVLKWCLKLVFHAIFWVFAMSINWHGRPVFYIANELLVQNALVQTVDESLGDLWHRVVRATKVAFAKNTPDDTPAL